MSLGSSSTAMASHRLAPPVQGNLSCYLVNKLASSTEEQCKFIFDNDCLEHDGTFDYVYLVYCKMGQELRLAAIALIVFVVIILFLNLSSVADEFLCPSLLTVAKNLRMSDSLAGVTLLAFGNGCPDIFSSLAAASSNRPELIVGELLGAGIFCTSIVAGLVFINSDFKPLTRPLLRDGTFYMLSVCMVWYYCSQRMITFYGSVAFIIVYVIYLIVALGDQLIQSRLSGKYVMSETSSGSSAQEQRKKNSCPTLNENILVWRRGSHGIVAEALSHQRQQAMDTTTLETLHNNNLSNCNEIRQVALEVQLVKSDGCTCNNMQHSSEKIGHVVAKLKNFEDKNQSKFNVPAIRLVSDEREQRDADSHQREAETNDGQTKNECDHFLSHLSPIDLDVWKESGIISKIIQVLRAPLLFITILTVPVVDLDKTNNNWCRVLNSLHCFMIPTALILISNFDISSYIDNTANDHYNSDTSSVFTDNNNYEEYSETSWLVPLVKAVMIIPGFLVAVFVFRKTEPFKVPKYHAAFAYFGFAMSVTWIYLLANEIICFLKTIGIIFSMTDTAIGLGVLAWGNSLGDIVANLSLADAGYPRMALGASIGAPLLNLLLGFGLSFTLQLRRPGQSSTIEYTPTVVLLCTTLNIILITLMLSILIPSNKSRKPFGYVLILGYAIYFALAVCLECNLLFPQTRN